jgi:hypothetical protein
MRLTVNLDDDLYAMARSYSISEHLSISRSLNELLRRKLTETEGGSGDQKRSLKKSGLSRTGLKVSAGKPNLTEADVLIALANEDVQPPK